MQSLRAGMQGGEGGLEGERWAGLWDSVLSRGGFG